MTQEKKIQKKAIGKILKEAREARGLTYETVHEMTKIPIDVLKAIEEEYTVRTLTPFYVKGFTRMYARYLEVDPDEFDLSFPETAGETDPDLKTVKVPERRIPVAEKTPVLTRDMQRRIVQGAGVLLVLFLVTRLFGCLRHKAAKDLEDRRTVKTRQTVSEKKVSKKAEEKKAPVEKPKPVVKPKPKPKPAAGSQKGVVSEPKPAPAKSSSKTVSKNVNLTVKAKRRVWLQVKVDGSVVFQSTLQEGVAETWRADQTIEISGKNIYYLEFELNGKVLGGLGRADRQARRIVIDKKGLSVKR